MTNDSKIATMNFRLSKRLKTGFNRACRRHKLEQSTTCRALMAMFTAGEIDVTRVEELLDQNPND